MADPVVLSDLADGILTLTLNRPDRGNAWNDAMADAFLGALEDAARTPEVRAIVVTGAGNAFCAGGDGAVLQDIAAAGGPPPADRAGPGAGRDHLVALRIGKPVIAAINGACFGIGMQQALCCDIRIASDDAKFATAFARRGVIAEQGIAWLLPRLVGTGHALDLLLSARLVRAAEAERMGLVNRVVPRAGLMAEARAYAAELVHLCAPGAMRTIKAQVWGDLDRGLQDACDRAGPLMDAAFAGAEFREGVASWQEGRPPVFPPLSAPDGMIEV